MNNCIIYISSHHKNTKALVEAIAASTKDLTVYNGLGKLPDLDAYDVIGFASGIAHGKMYPQIFRLIETKLPKDKKIFFIYTCGVKNKKYINDSLYYAKKKNANVLGTYSCKGYDTFGFWGTFGGIAKKHPNDKDKEKAIEFYNSILNK